MAIPFWQENPDAPFATLLRVLAGTYAPDAWEDAREDLQRIVREYPDRPEWVRFKVELRQAARNPDVIPSGELDKAVDYSDGPSADCLVQAWRDLYPGEPL